MSCCIPSAAKGQETSALTKPESKFSSSLCECCDCGAYGLSCVVVSCLSPVSIGQLYERIIGGSGSCRLITIILAVLTLAMLFLQGTQSALLSSSPAAAYFAGKAVEYTSLASEAGAAPVNPAAMIVGNVAGLISFGVSIASCILICKVRQKVRSRDNIPETSCCKCCFGEDCCMSFWCLACTQCVLFRHEGLTNDKYNFCSPTGETLATAV